MTHHRTRWAALLAVTFAAVMLLSVSAPAEAHHLAALPAYVQDASSPDGIDSSEVSDVADSTSGFTSVTVAKGSDFWYSLALVNGRLYTVGNLRYSWSWMWYLKLHYDYYAVFVAAACNWIGGGPAAACAAAVGAFYTYTKGRIDAGIAQKKCLQIRFPMPPLVGYQTLRFSLVTCRI